MMRSAPLPMLPHASIWSMRFLAAQFQAGPARAHRPRYGNVQNERATAAAAVELRPADDDGIARTVAKVWQQVLQTPVAGPEDDFFEAGGDSLRRSRSCSSSSGLWAWTFIDADHGGAEVRQTMRGPERTSHHPLCPAGCPQTGDGLPPVFIIHASAGVSGTLPDDAANDLPGAVIGIPGTCLDGHEPPHVTVEAMAAEYLREVKTRQPDGPYYLCGYSFGGLVAFEMARRLWESGDESPWSAFSTR